MRPQTASHVQPACLALAASAGAAVARLGADVVPAACDDCQAIATLDLGGFGPRACLPNRPCDRAVSIDGRDVGGRLRGLGVGHGVLQGAALATPCEWQEQAWRVGGG
jgi:hypothetical protein